MKAKDTKGDILDATSLRQIISSAKVSLAAVHYHFGSKESLMQAVMARRLVPLNAERLALLEEQERAHGRRVVPLAMALRDGFHLA